MAIFPAQCQTKLHSHFFTPPKARSDLPPSLTHLQYMPSIHSCHLFSLAIYSLAIYFVLPSL